MEDDDRRSGRRSADRELGEISATLKQHEDDIKGFAPMVREVDQLKARVDTLSVALNLNTSALQETKKALEENNASRTKNRILIWVAVIGLVGTFLSSTATVLVALS